MLRTSAEQGHKKALELYNGYCAADKTDTPQAELEKRLNDEITKLVKSAEALGAVK